MTHPHFISDLHLGHTNMALKRGFSSVEEHDEFIVKTWNSVIKSPKTLVYIGGDITMERANYEVLNRMVGRKVVIGGNHDLKQHISEMLRYVEAVVGCLEYKGFVITHIPIHESEIERFRGNIHGHNHDQCIDHPKYLNIAAEQLQYKPHSLEELIRKYGRK